MCLDQKHEYGTMLRIVNYEQLADGRSRVDCIGEERFRVISWGEKDGYSTGRVTWVDDTTTEAVMEVVVATTNPDGSSSRLTLNWWALEASAGDSRAVWNWDLVGKQKWCAHCGQHHRFRPRGYRVRAAA